MHKVYTQIVETWSLNYPMSTESRIHQVLSLNSQLTELVKLKV